MSDIKRTIAGLARLSQRGSIDNARLGCDIISRRRNMTAENAEMTSVIASMAPNNRDAILAIYTMADHSAQIQGFPT